MTRSEVAAMLLGIVSGPNERERRIREFQEYVLNTEAPPSGFDDREWEVMADLAYDLDFYEEDPERRREDTSFYGEERLVREIHDSMAKLSNT